MGQLHELLAVEGDLKLTANRAAAAMKALFTDGTSRFNGQVKQYHPLEEGGEDFPNEVVPLDTTVEIELNGFAHFYGQWVDAVFQKENANQEAFATLEFGGDEGFKSDGIPATALLNLEGKLSEIRDVITAIPVIDPLRVWGWDEDDENYVSESEFRYRTQKIEDFRVIVDATDRHPAHVERVVVDRRVGQWETILQSGTMSKHDKADMLERVNEVLLAVKKARQQANKVEVAPVTIAEDIFNYILG